MGEAEKNVFCMRRETRGEAFEESLESFFIYFAVFFCMRGADDICVLQNFSDLHDIYGKKGSFCMEHILCPEKTGRPY